MSEHTIVEEDVSVPQKARSLGANIFLQAFKTPEFRVGAVIFIAVILLSVAAPGLLGLSATKFNVGLKFSPPWPAEGSVWPHVIGTDQLGRDLLARSLIGLRNALMIGITSVVGMFVLGSAVGMLAGYVGGWTNLILMRITDAQMSIPVIILAITILGVTRPTPLTVILVFILAGWPGYARVARSVTMSERRKEYVRAAKILGASDLRILLVHIAPNILPPIAFVAVLDVARMMIFEAILGFIGIGIQPPTPTFGTIIADGTKYLLNAWWITTIPGLLLAISLCSINLMGGALERSRNKLLQGVV
ncbi:ABC transporter permease [Mesorhizobium sp. M7A.F.Ca.US.001.01.1.1]|uniref:ABC transporter permease n=1 Tax=unclassified Mesorhizobium TaxID=325217 RepID=UPI0007EE2664|nr:MULTISPECIES: ABC transporter permease [unclassified Mesorhizobium]ARP65693.1 peptide ABC transporter permease [Mesorhizobium sp. WSM1497]MBZ9889193.1 ABC transporter permease [Mesorhizobium sp. BR1-1-3]RVA57548.1 ABC transporter permease [Mesorhizobium sp. M7A.F.Ca.US.001.01.1.1]